MKWKFMQIEPQPARGVLREEMWDSPEWIAEEKYDGDRRIAQFCGKVVRFTGRRKSVKDGLFVEKSANVPHLAYASIMGKEPWEKNVARNTAALEGTVLDGEMIATSLAHKGAELTSCVGGMSKYVTSIMGSFPEEAVRKQIERGWLRYVVFDCLFMRGQDLRHVSLNERRVAANIAVQEWSNPFVSMAAYAYGKDKQRFHEKIIHRGGEGVVLKRLDHTYGDKTGWVKVKHQATADVVIMGFVPAKEMSVKKGEDKATLTKYAKAGLIGAIQCGQYRPALSASENSRVKLTEVATVSGMTDDLRAKFTKHPKKYIGKVIEIEHNGREPTGRFRHPRFGRFREDKNAIDCVYREEES